MATNTEFRLSDLETEQLERIAGECDVEAADLAKRGNYSRADDIKTAAMIVREYAGIAETVQRTAPIAKTGFGNL